MSRKVILPGLPFAAIVLLAATASAQASTPVAAEATDHWVLIASRFGMALAAAGCAYAQSRTLTAACEAVARNPGAAETIRVFTFMGLGFIEFLAFLTVFVIMMKW